MGYYRPSFYRVTIGENMSVPQNVDQIIHGRWIIPVIPENQIFEHCSLIIDQGNIIAITPHDEAVKRYTAATITNLDSHILIPGLVNAHGHTAMSLMRGFADDTPLQTWLEDYIWPTESQWVDATFVKAGTELAVAEMLRSGTTCFSDMYFFPEEVALTAQQTGIRCQVAFPVIDFPTAWGQGPDEYISKGLALHDDYRSNDLINIAFGPHAPYTVADEVFLKIATLAEELQTPIQTHLHETQHEVEESVKQVGKRPSQRLFDLGVLSPLTQCVHMTQVNDVDIHLLQQSGAHVVHCPESNLKLASGFCPVSQLQNAGINVALGTDGAASNNDLDLLGELQTAALLAKGVSGNAAALSAHEAIKMATLNGARALGLENRIGSLEPGKAADICAIAADELESIPLFNAASQLVYTRNSHRVTHVWVNGKMLLQERKLLTMAQHEIITKAQRWAQKLQR